MATRTEDEEGVQWIVKAGDPGRKAVSFLERRGYGYVVLTRGLLSGMVDKSVGDGVAAPPPSSTVTVTSADLIRAQRLHDCMEEIL